MPTSYKILAQAVVGTATMAIYTAPAATQTVVSTIHVSNTSSTNDLPIRIFVYPSGGSASVSSALVYDAVVPKNSAVSYTQGITLADGSAIAVRAAVNNSVTFTIFGSEIS